mgnify:CR=1 FL=1|jgi:hypothetical protein
MLTPERSDSGSMYESSIRIRPQKLVFFDLDRRRSSSLHVRMSVSFERVLFSGVSLRNGVSAGARSSTSFHSCSASEITSVSNMSSSRQKHAL